MNAKRSDRSRRRASRDIFALMIPSKPRGRRRKPKALYPKEFTRYEIAAIGVITIQWGYLEHMLLLSTAELVNKAGITMPAEATSGSFERRLAAWRDTIKIAVNDEWTRNRLLNLAGRISNVEKDRHKITHGLWAWYPTKQTASIFLSSTSHVRRQL